jgi:TonB-linked SusC/RagA family outer membrane protein
MTKRFSVGILLLFVFLPLCTMGQTRLRYTIKGRITDNNGEALIGSSVQMQENRQGAVANADGNYELTVQVLPGTYTLTYRYLGYATQVHKITLTANNQTLTQNISLEEDILGLDEVLVTGNSPTATRRQLGNGISVVDASKLSQTGSNNTLGAISGKVMGAQVTQNSGDPAGGFSVQLRGASSIKGSSDPLYIVDGVIVDNSSQNVINLIGDAMAANGSYGQNRLVDINPNDIERIEVLNGAAAAAIYGSRASNGVVQIFTKRGKNGKPQVEFSTATGMSQLRKQTYLTTNPQRFGVAGNTTLTTAQDRLTTLTTVGLTTAQITAAGGTYVNVGPGAGRNLVTSKYNVSRYNYWDNIFNDGSTNENNLSISGGNDKSTYFLSLGQTNNDGIVRNTNFQKYTSRLRLEQQLGDKARLNVGLGFANSRSKDMPIGTNFFSPISTVYIIDNVWDLTAKDANGNLPPVEQVRMNPLSVLETFNITQQTNRSTGNVGLDLFPVKGLTINAMFGYDTYALVGNEFHPRVPYSGVSSDFYPDGYVGVAKDNVMLLNGDLSASYAMKKGSLASTTTTGYNIQRSKNAFSSSEGRDLAPFVETLTAAANIFRPSVERKSERQVQGYYLQETLGYKDALFVTVAGRIDGSSAFAQNHQNNFYPKASVSYLLSELWKGNDLSKSLNSFKLRASYGEAGNLSGIGAYDRYDNYVLSNLTGFSAISPSSVLGNPDARPERMSELEFGADIAFLKRFALSVNVYQQKVTDLLFDVQLPPSAGGVSIVTNVNDSNTYMNNNGFEAMLTANLIKNKDMSWDMSFLYNTNKNAVHGLGNSVIALRGADGPQYLVEGQPFGVFYGRFYARNADGSLNLTPQNLRQPQRGVVDYAKCTVQDQSACASADAAGDPLQSDTELRKVLGSPDPDWTGSFSTDFRFKKASLHLQLDAVMGQEVYNWNRITGNNVGHGLIAECEITGQCPRGTVASIAGGVTGQRIQEEHVEDGSFVKVRELALSYDLSSIFKRYFTGTNLSLVGRNLYSFDNYTGFDPETNSAGQTDRVRGDDFGNVPIPRTVQLRLNFKF